MQILDTVLPIFLVIAVGYLLRSTGFVGTTTNAALSRLVFYVAAPALLLRSAALAPLSETVDVRSLAVMLGASLLVSFVIYFAVVRAAPSRRGVLAQGAFRSNMVFVGLPIVAYAYGESVLGSAAVMIGFMIIIYNFVSVLLLTLPHRRMPGQPGSDWSGTLLEILKNPLIISCGIGIVCSALELPLPKSVDRSLELIGRIAMPLALLSVGASLDLNKLRSDFLAATLVSAVKLIVYPALIYAGLYFLGLRGAELECPVLIMGAPTAVVSTIMAREMRGDEQLAAAIVIGTTVGSLLTLSGWLYFFSW